MVQIYQNEELNDVLNKFVNYVDKKTEFENKFNENKGVYQEYLIFDTSDVYVTTKIETGITKNISEKKELEKKKKTQGSKLFNSSQLNAFIKDLLK